MRILFLGYWPYRDVLTQSTVLPHLEVLSEFEEVEQIVFCSIERESKGVEVASGIKKTLHIPLHSKNLRFTIVNKINDFIIFPRQIVSVIREHNIDYVIARGAPAGALMYLVWKKTKIPYTVESFEPHSGYMLDSGTWKSWDPRYIFQKRWEEKQKQTADKLIVVSHNYREKLVSEGVPPEKVLLMPCEVDPSRFEVEESIRSKIRKQLGIGEKTTVGIYIGKFGDIYMDDEAFELFKQATDFIEDFFLIIGSPQDRSEILDKLERANFPKNRFWVEQIPFEKVPDYLAAADFAFSTIRSTPNRRYCSPIKNGEYWAAGLPIVIPEGIGDDSDIIKDSGLGLLISDKKKISFSGLESIRGMKKEIRKLAEIHRNPESVRECYNLLIKR